MKTKHTIQHYFFGGLMAGAIQLTTPAIAQTVSLEKKWETPVTLKEPESVLYDEANKVLYVSNINDPAAGKDGNGSIGRISLDGDVKEVEWAVGGMDSPKGLGLSKGLLYVADLTNVVVIDVNIYQAEVWLENDSFQKPNGLLAHEGKFYMIDMGTGIFYEVDKKTKALRKIAEGLAGGDGIVPYGNDFIISNWNGEINHVSAAGKVTKLLDTKADKVNAADIEYVPAQHLLLVPTFFANKVVAYQVKP